MLKVEVGVAAEQVTFNEQEDAWPFKGCDSGCCNAPEVLKSRVTVYLSLALFIRNVAELSIGAHLANLLLRPLLLSIREPNHGNSLIAQS